MISIHIEVFGKLTDILSQQTITLTSEIYVQDCLTNLYTQYPALQQQTFVVAVNHKITHENLLLQDGFTVALLPPFAGG